jgi:hypothetical protein
MHGVAGFFAAGASNGWIRALRVAGKFQPSERRAEQVGFAKELLNGVQGWFALPNLEFPLR